MKINLIFLLKVFKIKQLLLNKNDSIRDLILSPVIKTPMLCNFLLKGKGYKITSISKVFLKNSITLFKFKKSFRLKSLTNNPIFLNRFVISFLEFFFKSSILFNLKKGSNKLILKQVSFRKFSVKYFKKNLKTTKQIIGVLYYSLLLKDASIFLNFFKKILENLNIKLHKKLFLGLRKLLKDFFKPIFVYIGVSGIFFNVKGKIGVSGSAKKRRYFFYFGRHSITSRNLKMDLKFLPI